MEENFSLLHESNPTMETPNLEADWGVIVDKIRRAHGKAIVVL